MTDKQWQYPFSPSDDPYVDLSSYDAFNQGAPFATFERMRDHGQIVWTEETGGRGFWSVVRHKDIAYLNKHFKLASSAQGIRIEDQSSEEFEARKTFQETDPPQHSQTRMLLNKAFSGQSVALFEDRIRNITVGLLEYAIATGELDATREIASHLPMRMLGQILGVPDEDTDWLVRKGDALISNTDPDYTDFVVDAVDTDEYRFLPFRSPAAKDLFDYANTLLERIRAGEEVGVLSLVKQPDKNGHVMTDDEFRNFFCLVVAAGNDTTRYALAATMHALANNPALLDDLKANLGDEAYFKSAAEEMIRWASPTTHFRRTATEDFEYGGEQIREGDKIVLWYLSANRDAAMFDQPYAIDFTRKPNRSMAFGQGGPHVCLGMFLAKLEVRVVLEELARRVARLEQTGPHSYLRSNFILGIKKLPMKFIGEKEAL